MAREKTPKTDKSTKSEKPAKGGKAAKAPAKKPAAPKADKAKAPGRGPLARLKALHGSKEDLVKKLVEPLAAADEDTEALGERLRTASNQQLLRLAKAVDAVKAKYGSRDKLIASLGQLVGKAKDKDYLAKLGTFSLPQLLDLARTFERRARA